MLSTSLTTRPFTAPETPQREGDDARTVQEHRYAQILKSTALIGGSSFATIAFGIVRTKVMALVLGPAGVGLMGLYSSIADLAQTVAGMGIQNSGVRQIAEAVGSGDAARVARTAAVLRRTALMLGLTGAVFLAALARPVSRLTFGGEEQTAAVALLSLVVLFRAVSAGQGALLQGMRRISDLATMNVLAAALSTAVTIPIVYLLRERGVVPSLVAAAAVLVVTSWWYSRKIRVEKPALRISQVCGEAVAILNLGLAFMASGFLTMGAAYAIRIIVLRETGFAAAGYYQAAWLLGGLYVGFILQAMGTDFYPRLTAVHRDNPECNRLVNEQAHVSMLLAGPGVIATLTVAPLVVALFYSTEFSPTVQLLRWICLGMTLRVVAWPMGFVVLAKGAQAIFIWTEVAATIVHVGLVWMLVQAFGLNGAAAAFFLLYLWHGVLIYLVIRRLSGFRWSGPNLKLGLVFLPLTAFVFCASYVFPAWLAATAGVAAVCFSAVYSARRLRDILPIGVTPPAIRRWLTRIHVAGAP